MEVGTSVSTSPKLAGIGMIPTGLGSISGRITPHPKPPDCGRRPANNRNKKNRSTAFSIVAPVHRGYVRFDKPEARRNRHDPHRPGFHFWSDYAASETTRLWKAAGEQPESEETEPRVFYCGSLRPVAN